MSRGEPAAVAGPGLEHRNPKRLNMADPAITGAAALLLLVVAAPPLRAAGEAPTNAPAPIALDRALELALRQNRDLRAAALRLRGRELDVSSEIGRFQWTLRPAGSLESDEGAGRGQLGADVTRRLEGGTEASVGGRFRGSSDEGADPYRRTAVAVQVSQPLLRRFGSLVNREPLTRAERSVLTARRELELRKTDLIVQVAELYEELFRLQRQSESDRQTVERLWRFSALSQARERQGRASGADRLRAEQKLGAAELRLASSVEALEARAADFAELLGEPPGTPLRVAPAPRLELTATDPEAAVGTALSNRLDYAQILQDCDDASRGLRIARRELLPDLRLITRYEQYGEGETANDSFRLNDSTWFVGLSADQEFPRRSGRVAVEQAAVNVEASGLRREAVEAGIARQVQQELLSYSRLYREMPIAERNQRVGLNRVRLARRQFENGKGDNFSVAEAEDELYEAETRLLSAEAGASVAAYRVMRVTGTLLEVSPELKPLAPGKVELKP